MSDSAKKPDSDDPAKSSTKLRAAIPHDQAKATQLTLEAGTHEHTALVEDVPVNEMDQGIPNRRRTPGIQTVINPPAPSGGLSGPWAIAGNASAIVVIMGAFIWFIVTSRSDTRERWIQDREDRAVERSQNQAAFAAVTGAISSMTSRSESREAKGDLIVDEFRRALIRQESVNQEILTVLRAIRDGKIPPEELGSAPMPRVKAGEG